MLRTCLKSPTASFHCVTEAAKQSSWELPRLLVCAHSLSHVLLFVTPWTAAHQAPLSMRVSKQEYWSGLPFPPPGDLPDPGTEPLSPTCSALAGRFFTTELPGKPRKTGCWWLNSWYNPETGKTLDKFHDLRSHTERQECCCHLKQCTEDRKSSKQVEKKMPPGTVTWALSIWALVSSDPWI